MVGMPLHVVLAFIYTLVFACVRTLPPFFSFATCIRERPQRARCHSRNVEICTRCYMRLNNSVAMGVEWGYLGTTIRMKLRAFCWRVSSELTVSMYPL